MSTYFTEILLEKVLPRNYKDDPSIRFIFFDAEEDEHGHVEKQIVDIMEIFVDSRFHRIGARIYANMQRSPRLRDLEVDHFRFIGVDTGRATTIAGKLQKAADTVLARSLKESI